MEIKRVEELMNIEPITSKADLARFLNVTAQTLSNWFSRNNIPEKYATLLAFYFSKKTEKTITEGFFLGSKNIEDSIKFVPIVGTTSCGGAEINYLQEENKKAIINSEDWKNSLYCVIANGDSMSPVIENNAKVFIDPTAKPIHGEPVYYKIDDESAIKIYILDEEAHIIQLVPINQNENFKTRTIRLDDEETLSRLTLHHVHDVHNPRGFNRSAILKMIGR